MSDWNTPNDGSGWGQGPGQRSGEPSGQQAGTPPGAPSEPTFTPPSFSDSSGGSGRGWRGSRSSGPDDFRLGPMTTADVLDNAVKLVRKNFKSIGILALAFGIPFGLLDVWYLESVRNSVTSGAFLEGAGSGSGGGTRAVTTLLRILLSFAVMPFFVAIVIRIAAAAYLGQRMDVQTAARGLKRFWLRIIGAEVLTLLALLGGTFAFVIPGIIAAVLFSAVIAVIAVEEAKAFDAMGRSWSLMKTRFWPYLGTLILAGIVAGLLFTVITFVLSALAVATLDSSFAFIGYAIFTLADVIQAFFTISLLGLIPALLYFDARVRNEAFDVQVMAARLPKDQPPPPSYS